MPLSPSLLAQGEVRSINRLLLITAVVKVRSNRKDANASPGCASFLVSNSTNFALFLKLNNGTERDAILALALGTQPYCTREEPIFNPAPHRLVSNGQTFGRLRDGQILVSHIGHERMIDDMTYCCQGGGP